MPPLAVIAGCHDLGCPLTKLPLAACRPLLDTAVVTAFGPLVYRLAYQSLGDASSLVLLIVSVGVHFAMTGLGLLFFGAEGFRNPVVLGRAAVNLGAAGAQSGQALIIIFDRVGRV
jgi:branched-chain amino acid transport system permease protein